MPAIEFATACAYQSIVSAQEQWESVYSTKSDAQVSWTQEEPRTSLSLIQQIAAPPAHVIDVGGGTSRLVDRLLELSYRATVLDISQSAIDRTRERLGAAASKVNWIVADITAIGSLPPCDVWHDRAVFHFLTRAADRRRYAALLAGALPIGRHAIIATFAPDGPERCSGLEVRRYDGLSLAHEIGGVELLGTFSEMHKTPWGKEQSFQYSLLRRLP